MKPIYILLLLYSFVFLFVACANSVVGRYHIENDPHYEFRYLELKRDKTVKISYMVMAGGFLEENLGHYQIDGNDIKILMEKHSLRPSKPTAKIPLIPAFTHWGSYEEVNGRVKVLYGTIEDGKLLLTDYHPEALLVKKR